MTPPARAPRAQLNVAIEPELQRLLNAVLDAREALDRPLNTRAAVKSAIQHWISGALAEPAVADLVRSALEANMVRVEPMRKYSAPQMGALLHDIGHDDLAGIVAPPAGTKAPKPPER